MLTYTYEAKNAKTGQKVKAQVQADNEQAAAKLLTGQGLTPLSIKVDKSGGARRFTRIKTKDKVLFSRQLATLINAGLPLVQSLRQVGKQTTNKAFKVVINQIITDVEAGTAFSVALDKHPTVFNRVYVSLVAAGETSGTLDSGLERLADQQEKDADIISKVRGAMIYPLIVMLVMFAVVVFMMVKVLPQVQSIYNGLKGVSLPIFTRVLLGVSHFMINFWWVMLIVLALLIFFGSRWARTLGGRSVVDKVKMKAWPVGPLFMKMYMARFARTGTTLVASGVPLIQVLEITSQAVDNVHISKSLERAIEKVQGGTALSDAIKGDPNFLELVPNMLSIGEQSGAMETMLDKVADYYEKEVDNEIKAISTIIEPVMMVLMGIVAITIVAAILLPIYGLVNQSGFTNSG
ncbi:MAG TPA: type II secretion system F family protein [Candidatus Saccharimonadales bacterium]|jgi:type IV pilus assembly protein PilC|nr:type II secretion system F family protein [Candidatus Saccharimonadales bacterium]